MDAKRDGIVFTPRHGKPVEIQALWHHALRCAIELLPDAPEKGEFESLAQLAAESLRTHFWWPERNCLHDVLMPADGGWQPDGRLRPNQLFAVSLDPSPFSQEQQQGIIDAVRQNLLTPVGVRTLDPAHADYIGRYEGDMMQRDRAYHNGTVWPWLIGGFLEAYLKVNDHSEDAKRQAAAWLQPLVDHLESSGCVGSISEIFEACPPHRPAGCCAQAWSVSEVLRLATMLKM
jgi:predicted glycogen debranching enzyme